MCSLSVGPTTASWIMFAQSEIIILAENENIRLLLVVVQTSKSKFLGNQSRSIKNLENIWNESSFDVKEYMYKKYNTTRV